MGNAHVYWSNGNAPIDEWNYALNTAESDTPQLSKNVITETGYSSASAGGGVDQTVQAKYILDLLMDAAKTGITATYLYQLVDQSADPTKSNLEDGYGLFNSDFTPKLAATGIHNLFGILGGSGSGSGTTSSLNLTLSGLPSGASSQLFQQADGSFDLAVWNEPEIWNAQTKTEISVAGQTVTLSLADIHANIAVYDPLLGETSIASSSDATTISFTLTDHPIILKIIPVVDTTPAPTPVVTPPVTTPPAAATPGVVVGDGQADHLSGGASATTISGFGTGSQLTDGAGADTFVFSTIGQSTLANETVINGFKAGDILDFSAINPNFKVVNQFDGHAGEIVLAHMGNGNWQVEADTNGDGSADFAVHVVNTTVDLAAASFNFSAATAGSSSSTATNTNTTPTSAASAAAASAAAATAAAAAAATTAAAPVAVAQTSSLIEHATVTGNALTGDTGTGLSLVSVGIGTDVQHAVTAGGTTFVGQHGSLTINPDGSYAYVELRDALTAGTVWDDHFTITVAAANGKQSSTTLDFIVTGSPTGNGGVNYITGGASATTISGFGAGSQLTSGVGADTFVFNSIGQSTLANETLIKGFKSGDIIDLSAIDPAFQVVSQFDGHAHELMLAHIGNGNWQVEGDTTGLGAPTFAIHVFTAASANLSAASFHL